MRFTGHLDLHRAWERSFRRARLPIAYTQGFNPQPRINLAAALPLGFTSEGEIADIWLEQQLTPDAIMRALQPALPPGIQIHGIHPVDLRAPSLQGEVISAEYVVTFLESISELDLRLQELLAAGELPRRRRGKDYDLRPLIEAVEAWPADDEGHQRLFMRLAARAGATGRPEEVVSALGAAPEDVRVHRTRLIFRQAIPELQRI